QCQTALQRTQHAALGIGIHGEENLAAARDPGSDRVGMLSHHHNYRIACRGEQPDQPVQESLALELEQRFGGAHAAGCAAGKNDARDLRAFLYFAPRHLRMARDASLARMDLEAIRHSASGARLMAIISATMDTAISSGVMAPISRPMGAKTRSNAARGMPSFSNSFTTPITLRLLPIIAMYLALVSTAQRRTRMSSRCPRVTITR